MNKRSLQIVMALIIGFIFVISDAVLLCAQDSVTAEFTPAGNIFSSRLLQA